MDGGRQGSTRRDGGVGADVAREKTECRSSARVRESERVELMPASDENRASLVDNPLRDMSDLSAVIDQNLRRYLGAMFFGLTIDT